MFDLSRLKQHKLALHTAALALMLGAAAALYFAANAQARGTEIGLLLLFTLANALILMV